MKKTAAGLILFTKDPHKGLVAVLSRRGEFDYEKLKPEKYQNLYEVTAGGGIESGEHLIEGLMREVKEELGGAAGKLICQYASGLHQVAYEENENFIGYAYALYIPHFPLALLKPHRSSAGVRFITAKELSNLKKFEKNDAKKGPEKDDKQMWVLPHLLDGLKKGFQLFSQTTA